MKIASEGFLKEKGNVEPTVINQEQRIKIRKQESAFPGLLVRQGRVKYNWDFFPTLINI